MTPRGDVLSILQAQDLCCGAIRSGHTGKTCPPQLVFCVLRSCIHSKEQSCDHKNVIDFLDIYHISNSLGLKRVSKVKNCRVGKIKTDKVSIKLENKQSTD